MKITTALALLALVTSFLSTAQAVNIETVPVGNPGNAADSSGYGAVSYEYYIGKTEVTNDQYTEFLNAVAASDPYTLYKSKMGSHVLGAIIRSGSPGNYTYAVKEDAVGQGPGGSDYSHGNKPVALVNWYDAIRFVNWLHNGQGSGDTETGAYTLLGGTQTPYNANGDSIVRNPEAKWFLPSENEWYKAAYHKNDGVTANYWDYPTSTDTVPNNNLPSDDTGNSANFRDGRTTTTSDHDYPLTDAGAYPLSRSPYGTFDQGGNVMEWAEDLFPDPGDSSRVQRSGFFRNDSDKLSASRRSADSAWIPDIFAGFRVASVIPEPSSSVIPEPSSLLLGAMAITGLLQRRRRRS